MKQLGALAGLQLRSTPKPKVHPGEVLVEVHAAAINCSDVHNVMGKMPQTTLPRIPGRDFAGVVVEGHPTLLGTEVWGSGGELGCSVHGSHADYLLIPVAALQPKPYNLSMPAAASIGVSYITAWRALIDIADIDDQQHILIIGGSGAVGSAAIGLAKWQGAQVITTIEQPHQHQQLQRLQVDEIIDLNQQLLPEAIAQLTQNRGVDVIVDTLGGPWFQISLQCLAPQGRLLIMAASPAQTAALDLTKFYRQQWQLFGINTLDLTTTQCAQILAELKPLFEGGHLLPLDIETLPLEEGINAYRQVYSGKTTQKVVLTLK